MYLSRIGIETCCVYGESCCIYAHTCMYVHGSVLCCVETCCVCVETCCLRRCSFLFSIPCCGLAGGSWFPVSVPSPEASKYASETPPLPLLIVYRLVFSGKGRRCWLVAGGARESMRLVMGMMRTLLYSFPDVSSRFMPVVGRRWQWYGRPC